MNVIFHSEAKQEFRQAILSYQEIDRELGADFELKVEEALALIVAFPRLGQEIRPQIRRMLLRRFPYGVLYSICADCIYIVAVMHLHARPDYWQSRIN